MGTKDLKRIAIERIKKAGYEYAKYKYENWIEGKHSINYTL